MTVKNNAKMNLTNLSARQKNAMRHLSILVLLLVAFIYNFAHRDGWQDSQWSGDEPLYIEKAHNLWQSGTTPGSITWSPGYVTLMSPLIGIAGKEMGYKLWRFALFLGMSFLAYAAFFRMFKSTWIGVVAALYIQLFLMPYASPSLQGLVCLLYLMCLCLLTENTKYLGVVFGILLNGIFVSGAVGSVLFTFATLCLIFYPRLVFSMRFGAQLVVGVVLFSAVLHSFNYDIKNYSDEASQRGRAGLYHQLSLYIVSSGRSSPYLEPGEDDPALGVDEYHRHLKAIDRYYVDKFGEKEFELRAYRHDVRWPLFLLDWPWMIGKDPALMREYGYDVFETLKNSITGAFEIIFPFGDYDVNTKSPKRGVYLFLLIILLTLPSTANFAQKGPQAKSIWPSRLHIIFGVSILSTLIPLTLVKPLAIYFPPLIPAYLMGAGLFALLLVHLAKKLIIVTGYRNIGPGQ